MFERRRPLVVREAIARREWISFGRKIDAAMGPARYWSTIFVYAVVVQIWIFCIIVLYACNVQNFLPLQIALPFGVLILVSLWIAKDGSKGSSIARVRLVCRQLSDAHGYLSFQVKDQAVVILEGEGPATALHLYIEIRDVRFDREPETGEVTLASVANELEDQHSDSVDSSQVMTHDSPVVVVVPESRRLSRQVQEVAPPMAIAQPIMEELQVSVNEGSAADRLIQLEQVKHLLSKEEYTGKRGELIELL